MSANESDPSSKSNNELRQKYVDEFKSICRTEFNFLIIDHGFSEAPKPPLRYQNPFEVHYAKNHGRLVIEGLSYGFSAGVDVQNASGNRVPFHYLVPSGFWESHREGLGRGQHGDLRYWALCVREFGYGFLTGDWSGHDVLVAKHQQWIESNRAAQERESRELQAQRAVEASAAPFQAGDYLTAAKLLVPHEAFLTRSQLMRLKIARERAGL